MNRQKSFIPSEHLALIEKLYQLQSHLIDIHETERQQLASFINDTVIQTLSALHIQLSMLVSRPKKDSQEGLSESLLSLSDLMEQLLLTARGLRPIELDTVGFDVALRELCERLKRTIAVNMYYDVTEDLQLSLEATTAFYRLAQEALHNVALHEKATKVWVTFRPQGEFVILKVTDNGRGFDSDGDITYPVHAPSIGMFGWMIHFLNLGGSVSISSTTEKGTTVIGRLPLSHS